jgi:hypothetical protein
MAAVRAAFDEAYAPCTLAASVTVPTARVAVLEAANVAQAAQLASPESSSRGRDNLRVSLRHPRFSNHREARRAGRGARAAGGGARRPGDVPDRGLPLTAVTLAALATLIGLQTGAPDAAGAARGPRQGSRLDGHRRGGLRHRRAPSPSSCAPPRRPPSAARRLPRRSDRHAARDERTRHLLGRLALAGMEGCSKEVFALARHFRRSPHFRAIRLLDHQGVAAAALRRPERSLLQALPAAGAALNAWTSEVNHIYGSLSDWFVLRVLPRSPLVLTVATAEPTECTAVRPERRPSTRTGCGPAP